MNDERTTVYTIYGLIDPRYQAVRYVGMTKYTPEKRLVGHLKEVERGPLSHKSRWLAELSQLGLRPEPFVIEYVDPTVWQEAERRWIAYFGDPLTNMTVGGDGRVGVPHTPETRAKIGASGRGRRHSEATRRLLSERARARAPMSLEQRAQIATTLRGRARSVEATAKQRITFSQNTAAVVRISSLSASLPRDLLLARAAKAEATRIGRRSGLQDARKSPCETCGHPLRKIDVPRHNCARYL